ncbi:MAG: hypothetical protein ACPIA7_08220 [Akkermansiaceae bacterium]
MKLKPVTIAIAVLVAALAIGFLIKQKSREQSSQPAEALESLEQARSAKSDPRDPREPRTPGGIDASQGEEQPIPPQYGRLFARYLGDDSITIEQAADGLLAMAADPEAPLHVRSEALEHALNLTADQDFEKVNTILSSQEATIPEPLLQTVLNDSYNRVHITQVETAIRVLTGDYSEEIKEEALELLEFHTDEQHGNNIDAWLQAVENYRQQNAQQLEEEIIEDDLDAE